MRSCLASPARADQLRNGGISGSKRTDVAAGRAMDPRKEEVKKAQGARKRGDNRARQISKFTGNPGQICQKMSPIWAPRKSAINRNGWDIARYRDRWDLIVQCLTGQRSEMNADFRGA